MLRSHPSVDDRHSKNRPGSHSQGSFEPQVSSSLWGRLGS